MGLGGKKPQGGRLVWMSSSQANNGLHIQAISRHIRPGDSPFWPVATNCCARFLTDGGGCLFEGMIRIFSHLYLIFALTASASGSYTYLLQHLKGRCSFFLSTKGDVPLLVNVTISIALILCDIASPHPEKPRRLTVL